MVERHALPLSWYEVLLTLSSAPAGVRIQELMDCALMTKSGVSRLVDRMVGAGLITRQACPADRRGAYAVLTALGRRRFRRAAPTYLRSIEEHFARHLSAEDAQRMAASLDAVAATAGGCGRPCSLPVGS